MGFNQIEHKKLTSLVKMTNVFQANGTSYAYYILISYLPLTILQPTYLLTHPCTHPHTTYLDVLPICTYLPPYPPPITYLHINYLPTHPPTHLLTYMCYLPTYPPTYNLPTYLQPTYPSTHPPTQMYYLPTYPPTYNLLIKHIYLPTLLPIYLPTHPPTSYNPLTFVFCSLAMMC